MLALLLKLVLAHLLGDFLFQPSKWIKSKEERKHKSPFLYWHILIHTITLLFALQFDLQYTGGVFVIAISHFIIDLSKVNLKNKIEPGLLFFLDQIAHLLIIAAVVYAYEPFTVNLITIYLPQTLLLAISVLMVTAVSSVIMKVITTKWQLEEDSNNSLDGAGMYIGILERLFVFAFIITNHWQRIGFLLAAKSVFRFGDLSKAKDRKLTEYILIGTLLSFGLAIIVGLGHEYITTFL